MFSIIKLLINIFFPRYCCICNKELIISENHICLNCYTNIPLTYYWTTKNNPAEIIFWGRVEIERVIPLYFYINEYRKPIHSLKYHNNIYIGKYLGSMLGEKLYKHISTPHYIIPIPLHKKKKRKRGYNQTEIICKGIIKFYKRQGSDIPILLTNLIVRKRFTQTQTQKDKIDRWNNVKNAFELNINVAKCLPHNCNIVIVDDVLTTGATLDACAGIIKSSVKCKIYIATLAYVE